MHERLDGFVYNTLLIITVLFDNGGFTAHAVLPVCNLETVS